MTGRAFIGFLVVPAIFGIAVGLSRRQSGKLAADLRSELEAARRELADKEMRGRLTALVSNDAMWDWDIARNTLTWNQNIEKFSGIPYDGFGPNAEWWVAHLHPDDRDRTVSAIESTVENGGEFWSGTYRLLCPSGLYETVNDRGAVLHDAHGEAVRMIGSLNFAVPGERSNQRDGVSDEVNGAERLMLQNRIAA